ncbi:SDR family oxidoreductase [Salipiger sp. PrR002]|uniref:SDR family oxidoreductase n=1 Tax=Salipiger sp. PrR002 TaxID=2706489 RepID=UPI0013B813DC|nr:SDR family NAD(P)-dependent oxidoreductase [Salipiger sp. PrR002]NDV98323.1 SDR family NAD(P)-dependent oxidoreductase [Salipiger sp. PrR002]NDW55035.1 SDR family NAD(P)-dependent oxidoreductase [Salipiger sp. PrR004]
MSAYWKGRKVLLTGATRGIGRAMAETLVAEGASVLGVARNTAALEEMTRKLGPRFDGLEADLGDPEIPRGVVNWVADAHPDCSVLINNAAVMSYPLLTDGSNHDVGIEEEVQINMIAPMQIATALLPRLAAQKGARIVNVTSGLAVAPKTDAPIYCATKAGMRSFTRSLRYQAEDAGLHIGICEALLPAVNTSLSRGRAERKMPAPEAAAAILAGAEAGKAEIWIGKTKLLRRVMRLSPALAHGLMRRIEA